MRFIARINLPANTPPVRAYLHTAGFEEVYGGKIEPAADYLLEVLSIFHSLPTPEQGNQDFLLAAIWGEIKPSDHTPSRNLDLFGLSDIVKNWPGNPDVSAWVFENGVYKHTHQITCGDTLIMLGEEENFRRTRCGSLNDYRYSYPLLGNLEPEKDFVLQRCRLGT